MYEDPVSLIILFKKIVYRIAGLMLINKKLSIRCVAHVAISLNLYSV